MNSDATPHAEPVASRYRVDDLVVDAGTRQVTRDGGDLNVGGLSFDLLLALVRAAPNLVTFDSLMDGVWPGVVVSPETITQRVKLLRQALGDSADKPRYVLAVRGRGYRLAIAAVPLAAADIRPPATAGLLPPADEADGDAVAAGSYASLAAPAASLSMRRRLLTLAAMVLIAVVVWWSAERGPTVPPRSDAAASPRGSIAVLPFANLTGDPANDYLSDGMAEEMINALGRVPGLKVPARTSSFAYKNRSGDVRAIAEDLGVGTLLEGSVRSAGERLRISAQMVDARTGYQIWSESYDREFDDIFALQDDLASAVVQAFRQSLGVDLPAADPRRSPTQDVDAYQFYLQAESIVNGTPESFLAAVALYDEALARDPGFARALAGRALNRAALVWSGSPLATGLADAQRDAERALALDPTLGRTHVVLASLSALRGEWSAAEASFRAAIATDPADADFRSRYAVSFLLPTGQLRGARDEAAEARRLAPGNSLPAAAMAFADQALGADDDAIAAADFAIARAGDPRQMAPVYASALARSGRSAEAAEHAIKVLPPALLDAGGAEAVRAGYAALADANQRPAALAALASLTREPAWARVDPRSKQFLFYLYGELGALDELYAEIEPLLRQRGEVFPEIIAIGSLWSPEMRIFRRDARFQALVQRLGLIDYWNQAGAPDDCTLADGNLDCTGGNDLR